jgi:hypothetical protein
MADVHVLFGVAAGVLDLVTSLVYMRSILARETKPDRVTWWILTIANGMITASYIASGARATIWLPCMCTLGFLVVAVMSVRYGEGPLTLSRLDRVSLVVALSSALVWRAVHSPVPGLVMNICTEVVGLVPTIHKAYHRPWTESRASWVLATTASLLNVLAIGDPRLVIAAYPLYVFLTNVLITYFILRKRAS